MTETVEFMVRHGPLVLFVIVLIEQLGVPFPSPPFLLAAGALAAAGKLNGAAALIVATSASVLADLVWFYLGRLRGSRILSFLCRISLEPDSCVRRTEALFTRYNMRAVIAGKFIPGLSTVMPPLAGMFKVKVTRFVAFDSLGSFLYVGGYLLLGWLFSNQLQALAEALGQFGQGALIFLVVLVAAYIAFKFTRRWLLLRRLQMARITVEELRERLAAGEDIFIVDLRSAADLQINPVRIKGSRHFPSDQLDLRHHEIPRDREVVLYCSCPNEISSARAALRLHQRGIVRVRPLLGGIDAWREHDYPTELPPINAESPLPG